MKVLNEALRHIFRLPAKYFTETSNAQIINNVSSGIEIGSSVERHNDFMTLAEGPVGHLPMPATVEAIKLSHVSFKYDDVPVFEDINLDFSKGEIIAIIGANGSGKSSLIQLLLKAY